MRAIFVLLVLAAVIGLVHSISNGFPVSNDDPADEPPREPVKARRVDSWAAQSGVEVTRQPVPGGWLYVTTIYATTGPGRWGAAGVSSVFVPEIALPVERR